MKIAVTLTSSLSVGEEYINLTKRVGKILASSGFEVIYGGTEYGMMKELATSYKNSGGKKLYGVMSKELESITKNYKAYSLLDEEIWTEKINDRIRKISEMADGFVILPGGYGTLEEMVSIVGGKANKIHNKPILILNYNNFYNNLISFFNEIYDKNFSKIKINDLVDLAYNPEELIQYFKTYSGKDLPDKFV